MLAQTTLANTLAQIDNLAAMKAAKMTDVSTMEPLLPEDRHHRLSDAATELVAKSSALAARLHPRLRATVGDLVRSMNCYYSNLIEGHNTHPIDIDRALAGTYATDSAKRNLQLEAVAHIEVQRLIDYGHAPHPTFSTEFIVWLHREFCSRMPDDLLWATNPDTSDRRHVEPGKLRTDFVRVGRLIPPAPDELPTFLARFTAGYTHTSISKIQRIIAVGASHHRLLWIHPFLDGNGRVARLFSHALLRELGVGCELWAVSRGLARQVDQYKACLMSADQPRRGDLDGRGNLTLAGLEDFCQFFLDACLDQVVFMEQLLEPKDLLTRMEVWCEEQTRSGRLLRGSWPLLRESALAGEVGRGRAGDITGYKERQARTVLNDLMAKGLLVSDSPRGAVRLGFPITVLDRWLPRLYPGSVS